MTNLKVLMFTCVATNEKPKINGTHAFHYCERNECQRVKTILNVRYSFAAQLEIIWSHFLLIGTISQGKVGRKEGRN